MVTGSKMRFPSIYVGRAYGGLAQTLLLNLCDAPKAQVSRIVPVALP